MVAFTVVHGIWIADISFNDVPMVVSGAGYGASIVWNYRQGVSAHSRRKWLATAHAHSF